MASVDEQYFLSKFPKGDVKELYLDTLEVLKPPPNYTVSEYISKFMKNRDSKGYYRSYNLDKTHYMKDPLDVLTSREITQVIFMGPARTGKSESLLKGFAAYCIGYSKQNLLIIHMTQDKAAEWSKNEFQVMINASPELRKQKTDNPNDISVHEARFKSLNLIYSKWPTKTNLAAVTIQNVIFTDYDRIPENIDGEGNAYSLGQTRTVTYRNLGMTVAESSPGFPVIDPRQQLLPHECYKSKGIASLYSLGDQHCYYYQCLNPECSEYFMAEPSVIWWDDSLDSIAEKSKSARVKCPVCGHLHTNKENKTILIPRGKWVAKGQRLDKNGNLHGKKAVNNKIRSYWLRAPACAFIDLEDIVFKYLNALKIYEDTGSEAELQAVINTTFGEPYVERRYLEGNLTDTNFNDSIDYTIKAGECPSDTIILIASVDIQNGKTNSRFEFAIFAYTLRQQCYLVYRGEIKTFRDIPVQPDIFKDHFIVIEEVIMKLKIKVQDKENTYMKVHSVVMDEGGENGTTQNAKEYYADFYNRFDSNNQKYTGKKYEKFILIKGVSHTSSFDLKYKTIPKNASRTDRIPVLLCRTLVYKDQMFNRFRAKLQQSRSFHLNDGLSQKVFKELVAEEKTAKGFYQLKKGYKRNETIDLTVYFLAIIDLLKVREAVEDINSNNISSVPKYLLPIDKGNENVMIDNIPPSFISIEDFESKKYDVDSSLTVDETLEKNEELQKEIINTKKAIVERKTRQKTQNKTTLNFGIRRDSNNPKVRKLPTFRY